MSYLVVVPRGKRFLLNSCWESRGRDATRARLFYLVGGVHWNILWLIFLREREVEERKLDKIYKYTWNILQLIMQFTLGSSNRWEAPLFFDASANAGIWGDTHVWSCKMPQALSVVENPQFFVTPTAVHICIELRLQVSRMVAESISNTSVQYMSSANRAATKSGCLSFPRDDCLRWILPNDCWASELESRLRLGEPR